MQKELKNLKKWVIVKKLLISLNNRKLIYRLNIKLSLLKLLLLIKSKEAFLKP
uniref:Uncharacterized protein n=1 Tax=Siphoviridae sp. ctLqe90 TaxID=2825456 RepID=A0A8S5Q3Z5_9CAUD|nr:MAG TPA: hypothetical protein [Siphoviridae sp. ctLqe90]